MEKLLKLASQAADQAEVYYVEGSEDSIEFNNGKLDKADSALSSGIALRVIKDGKMGLAHTRNLLDREALVRQALASAANGVEVNFQMPRTANLPATVAFDPRVEKLAKQDVVAQGARLVEYVAGRVQGQVNVNISYEIDRSGIMNTAGTDLSERQSGYALLVNLIFPGTGSGLFQYWVGRGPVQHDQAELDKLIELFILSKNEVVPPTRRMPVIFTPFSLFALLSRFSAAASPVSIYNQVSPLCGKLGHKIVSDKLSLWQDPLDPDQPNPTAIDAEGTPTRKLAFIDKGVFTAFPTDLNYASKLNLEPNGCGVRHSVEALPSAQNLGTIIGTGDASLEEMISCLREGLLVFNLMGAHSGNVLHGDYSVGVSTGFMIENGRITGRVKDCLLSGNAYETLSNIEAIENKHTKFGSHKIPSIICKDVSVAGK
ncbi:MAG: TldD/PmbA family protein [Candidatus Syntrophosphaera sp.]|nr:TldD/PmbA family protein [Candidatus Syntrophosphaera sp.]